MKALVVYDSVNGNTKKIAEAVARSLGAGVKAVRPGEVGEGEIARLDLLVIGSPTFGGRPTEAITSFISRISPALPDRLKVAVFDTRLSTKFVKVFGYAADRVAGSLKAGAAQVIGAQGFIVKGRAGPLGDGEVERAGEWGRQLGA